MALETALLMAFYAVAGTFYLSVGILLAAFMVGYATGCWAASRINAHSTGRKTKISLFIFFILAFVILFFCAVGQKLLESRLCPTFVYSMILFSSGLIVGAAYAVAHHAAMDVSTNRRKDATTVYAFDLLGAAFAALATGFLFMPFYGFFMTCYLAIILLSGGFFSLLFMEITGKLKS
jgi:MFS family permease